MRHFGSPLITETAPAYFSRHPVRCPRAQRNPLAHGRTSDSAFRRAMPSFDEMLRCELGAESAGVEAPIPTDRDAHSSHHVSRTVDLSRNEPRYAQPQPIELRSGRSASISPGSLHRRLDRDEAELLPAPAQAAKGIPEV